MNRNRADVLAENARLSRMEAPVYDQNHFEIFHPWEQQRLRRHLGRYDDLHRALDVGAGTGNVVTKVHAHVRVAVDLSHEMLERSRPKDPDVRLVVALAEALPFREATFRPGRDVLHPPSPRRLVGPRRNARRRSHGWCLAARPRGGLSGPRLAGRPVRPAPRRPASGGVRLVLAPERRAAPPRLPSRVLAVLQRAVAANRLRADRRRAP